MQNNSLQFKNTALWCCIHGDELDSVGLALLLSLDPLCMERKEKRVRKRKSKKNKRGSVRDSRAVQTTDRQIAVAMRRPYRVVMAVVMLPGVLFSDLISSPS